ncbi:hypothetical protein BYT27DRAFT_6942369 [Phlegmacium glaucopus]|nr:hypothetical protein BYT27DRAFT_6942369 [Phlegmacium glaucopus]
MEVLFNKYINYWRIRVQVERYNDHIQFASEYETAKEAQERATKNATLNLTKWRGIAGEIKQYKEQKSEADRFDALYQEQVSVIITSDFLLPKHVIGSTHPGTYLVYLSIWLIEDKSRTIVKDIGGPRQEQSIHEKVLESAPVLAVDERQSLKTLTCEEKTASCILIQSERTRLRREKNNSD